MKFKALTITGFFICGLSAAPPAMAEGNSEYEGVAADDMAIMELYFGEDQLVEAATRHPKPISQVAENVTIITAEEIEAMHAHTVAEVLARVPGLFVQFFGRSEPGIRSALFIHGSDYEHVLVLVDGIRWNNVDSDIAETNDIPVQIIDRIEVIKGAASSAWGSALGGVINIITKNTGNTLRPQGTAGLAVGESDSEHYHAELGGKGHDFSYYLFAGRRESDGILDDRFFDSKSLFGKFSYELSRRTRFSGEIGSSQQENRYLHVLRPDLGAWADFTNIADENTLFYAVDLENDLTDSLYFYLQLYGREKEFIDTSRAASSGILSGRAAVEGEQQGINSRLGWEGERQTVVLGLEFLDRENTDRDELTGFVAAPDREELWAFYLNDTIRLGHLAITPGLRYDHLTIADDKVSPSLGLTYRWSEKTLLRSALSRGFRKPAVALKEGDPLFHNVNPVLESETIWTYQAGMETTAIPCLWLKATAFRHQADHVWVEDPVSGAWVNNGEAKRTGLEVAVRTLPVYNLSLGVDYTFVRLDPDQAEGDDQYEVDLLLEFNDRKGLHAQLFGQYVWWSDYLFSPPAFNGEFDNFIWDLIASKRLFMRKDLRADLFFKVHNLFNGSQFHDELLPNAPRWLETGLQLYF